MGERNTEPVRAADGGHDPVTAPVWYRSNPSGVECIQITSHMNFCIGNAVKYLWRADLKGDGDEDLRKARQYIDFELERRELVKARREKWAAGIEALFAVPPENLGEGYGDTVEIPNIRDLTMTPVEEQSFMVEEIRQSGLLDDVIIRKALKQDFVTFTEEWHPHREPEQISTVITLTFDGQLHEHDYIGPLEEYAPGEYQSLWDNDAQMYHWVQYPGYHYEKDEYGAIDLVHDMQEVE